MNFWKTHIKELKSIGFTTEQIKALKNQFADLDATAILKNPKQVLASMPGNIEAEKKKKLVTLLEKVKQMQTGTGDGRFVLPQRPSNLQTFTIHLRQADKTGKPALGHFLVKVERLDQNDQPDALLFQGRTDKDGKIRLEITTPKQAEAATQPHLKIRLQVFGIDSKSLWNETILLDPKQLEISIEVELKPYQKQIAGLLFDWEKVLGKKIPDSVSKFFEQNKINTLADVRRKSVQLIKESSKLEKEKKLKEKALLDELQAHAHLQLVSRDHKVNQSLINAKFSNIFSIAAQSRASFVQAVEGKSDIDKTKAIEIHEDTLRKIEVLKNREVEQKVMQANGYVSENKQSAGKSPPCACDCQSAVSPLAYLADLLDLVTREVTYNDQAVSLRQLEALFHQQFGALPGDCTASEEIVRQVRICIEVLRNKALSDDKGDAADAAALEHAARAYDVLLNVLGTSSRELRLLRGASEVERTRRAQSLGIDTMHLDDLLLTPSEQRLETIFGLQDTSRDPLSYGSKLDDKENHILRWQLRGVEWQRNTDDSGAIFGKLAVKENTFSLTLFKDSKHQHVVAKADEKQKAANRSDDEIELTLVPENDSGLYGRLLIHGQASSTNFKLAVVPEFLTWQLLELTRLWQQEDHPKPLYSDELPIIDPDLLTEDDFCRPWIQQIKRPSVEERIPVERPPINPFPTTLPELSSRQFVNKAYKLWWKRRKTLNEKRASLDKHGDKEMISQVWPDSNKLNKPDWRKTVADDLQSKDETKVEDRVKELESLHLSPETFEFLNLILTRPDEEAPDDPDIRAKEREYLLDILINVVKRRDFFEQWRDEEKKESISLTPRHFCLQTTEPPLNPLRAFVEDRLLWKAELERNSQPPMIDPDILPAALTAGRIRDAAAFNRWNERNALLDNMEQALEETLEDLLNKKDLALDWLDKRLSSEDLTFPAIASKKTLLHPLGFENPDALQDRFNNGKPLEIYPPQHGLTGRELNTLLTIRKLVQDEKAKVDTQDWRHVFHILIQAEKRRYIYPQWREEETEKETENNFTLSPEYFLDPDDPRVLQALGSEKERSLEFIEWRADPTALRNWRSRLKARFQQRAMLTENLRTLVDRVEEATLPALRDRLIDALYDGLTDVEKALPKKDASNALLINTLDNGCRKATRVAQAIETLQLLIWGILNGQLENKALKIPDLNQEAFNARWRWSQSYATWRSAVFVFLYPENFLFPRIRPDENQTRLFKAILKVLDGSAVPSNTNDSEQTHENEVEYSPEENAIKQLTDQIFEILKNKSLYSSEGIKSLATSIPWLRYIAGDAGGLFYERRFIGIFNEKQEAVIEDILFLPLHFGLVLQQAGNYTSSLDFFRSVYDFNKFQMNTNVEQLLKAQSSSSTRYYFSEDWLKDELNPHFLAKTRLDIHLRFIQLSIIRCLLDYAEAEFSTDTSESLARARELYFTAHTILNLPELKQSLSDCSIGKLIFEVNKKYRDRPDIESAVSRAIIDIGLRFDPDRLIDIFADVDKIIKDLPENETLPAGLRNNIAKALRKYTAVPTLVDLGTRMSRIDSKQNQLLNKQLNDDPQIFEFTQQIINSTSTANNLFQNASSRRAMSGSSANALQESNLAWVREVETRTPIPGVIFEFCIPPNPVLMGLRLRIETGLFKLNNCMNLAGMHREVPAYAAPTDTRSGMPTIGLSGKITLPQVGRLQGTQYRYKALVERAKQLIGAAQQLEASYLSFLEKLDQEKYTILRARHDLGLANANVTLQGLRITEAENGQALAQLQWAKADEAFKYYKELVDGEWSLYEVLAYWFLLGGAAFQSVGAIVGITAGAIGLGAPTGGSAAIPGAALGALAGAIATGGGGLATLSSWFSMWASYERREREWEFQRDLAKIDKDIADVQKILAKDHYNIVNQEETIAQISADNASDVLNFLDNKFTNAELYNWMSGVVGGIYRYFLEQSTAIAKLAQMQLAFERQETGMDFILGDYWSVTANGPRTSFSEEATSDRRGMTGSARLLQDLTRMDQHAFTTDRRKLQMSKTISLATHDPIVFQQFRANGVLPFDTTLALFDRDFPGHYLRLIKRVRTTVIALIPPTQGIKATLSSTGISRVMVSTENGALFEERSIPREPESVALTAAVNDSGVFELQDQPEMLLPFEGLGVATSWEFRLPKAANAFDFRTIADVLVTIEYTALDSPIYRQQMIKDLDQTVSADRPFSFRHQFADAWYDLHHPELVQEPKKPLEASFSTRREDFPPNVTELKIEHITLYIAQKTGNSDPINLTLKFSGQDSAGTTPYSATTNKTGIAGTREGNAGSWIRITGNGKSPVGKWTLALEDKPEIRKLFEDDQIEDILFVITFGGKSAEWPQ